MKAGTRSWKLKWRRGGPVSGQFRPLKLDEQLESVGTS